MNRSIFKAIKNQKSKIKNYLPLLLIIAASCAKEIYTDEDAVNAKREAQKVGLTVMIRDIGSQETDLSGFTVSTVQFGEDVEGITSADGIASLPVVKGDVVFHVRKEGYVPVTAVATTKETDQRNNTAVMIPVFAGVQASGTLSGRVSVNMDSSEEPLAGAMVSIDMDMNELMRFAFPGMNGNIGAYSPGILTYSSVGLLQPVRTSASGVFTLVIPVTFADLAYTVNIHETALPQNTFCSANQTVTTNGQNSPELQFKLTPYEK